MMPTSSPARRIAVLVALLVAKAAVVSAQLTPLEAWIARYDAPDSVQDIGRAYNELLAWIGRAERAIAKDNRLGDGSLEDILRPLIVQAEWVADRILQGS